jgi:predicted extracellular nuclease
MVLRHMFLGISLLTAVNASAAPELYFSEYIEGSSNNKALEIANTTGSNVDLSSYEVQMYFNGNTTAGLTIALTGSVENDNVFVLANSNASTDILNVADQTNGAGWFNGDDAVVLLNGGVVVDSIGQIGVDPGSEWGAGDASTQNNTLRRIEPVANGDAIATDAFDPSAEWEGFAQDSFEDLGVFLGSSGGNGGGNGGGSTADITINELDADNPSTDSLEFIELYDGGQGSTALDGLVLVLFNGSDDASYDAIDLDGYSTDSNGYFVIGSASVANVDLVSFTTNGLQNGADAVALYSGDTADFANDTPITTTNLIDVVVYDTNDSDDSGLLSGFGVTEQVNEGGAGDKDNHSIQQCDTGYTQTTPTPGAENACELVVTIGQCGDPATLISAIQGAGSESPLVGTNVEVEAVVVGDFQGANQLDGFYIQEEAADQDGSAATSEGLFIFAGASTADVAVGDHIRVAGTVTEFFGLTEVNNVSNVSVCATGVTAAPTSIEFPVASAEALEAVEGMLINIPQNMVATENFNLGRFHEVVLASERLFQPTHLVAPGADALALQTENDLKRIILDDGSTEQNPETVSYPAPELTAFNSLRNGSTVANLTGVMSYGFSAYRIHPTEEPNFVDSNPREAEPEISTDGNLKIASFNVLNYFNGDGQGGGFPTARGADTVAEFERQRTKIINALLAIDADIVGLVEIENDGYDANSAIQDLVNGLNDAGQSYAIVDPGVSQIGTDAIAVGFIYKTDRVETVNAAAILDSSVDSRFIDTKNRPALAQTFRSLESQGVITLAVNHFKSKGSACDDVGDPNQNDGQGNCNGTRTLAADALADWLATDPTGAGDGDVMILGDLNAYAKEDPISALTTAGYTDLINNTLGADGYSYVFGGQFGYLDYALANASLQSQIVDVVEWHINSDEPRVLDYNEEFKTAQQIIDWYSAEPYRASDHDPVIVKVNLLSDLLGDFNRNGTLDRDDLRQLIRAIALKRRLGVNLNFDVNNDGRLNGRDLRGWTRLYRAAR